MQAERKKTLMRGGTGDVGNVRKKVDFPWARNQEMRIESFSLQNSVAIRRRVLDLPSEIHHLHTFAEKLDSGAEAPAEKTGFAALEALRRPIPSFSANCEAVFIYRFALATGIRKITRGHTTWEAAVVEFRNSRGNRFDRCARVPGCVPP